MARRNSVKEGEIQIQVAVNVTKADWKLFKELAKAEKIATAEKLGRMIAAPEVDPREMSLTARQKLEVAVRQHQHKLDQQFDQRVRAEAERRLEDVILPHYRQKYAEYIKVVNARKGIMDRATFMLIWSSVHPDSRKSVTDEKLRRAFEAVSALELKVLDERQRPTEQMTFPATVEELNARREEMEKRRKAARAAKKMAVQRR